MIFSPKYDQSDTPLEPPVNEPSQNTFNEQFSIQFQQEMIKRVYDYLKTHHKTMRDVPAFYVKSMLVLFWAIGSYYLLVFTSGSLLYKLAIACSLSLAIPSILFNITHDANHYAVSNRPFINNICSLSADLIGISSDIWRISHNRHHRNPNVMGLDFDLDQGYFFRISPHQPRYWFHTYQVFYGWALFPFILIRRNFIKDFTTLREIICQEKKTFSKISLCRIFGGKVIFLSLAFVLPAFFYPIADVIIFYCFVYGIAGFVISTVFIVTHINDQATFSLPSGANTGDFIHQIESSVDFSRNNFLLGWYLGGLNFQTEHHLFPYICHIHYPALSKIVEQTCHDFKVKYKANNTLTDALCSYSRWVNYLGKSLPVT